MPHRRQAHHAHQGGRDNSRTPVDLAGDFLPRGAVEVRVSDPLEPERMRLVCFQSENDVHVYHKTRKRYFPVPKALLLGGTVLLELWQLITRLAERTGRMPHDVCLQLIAIATQYLKPGAPPLFPHFPAADSAACVSPASSSSPTYPEQ